MNTFTFNPLMLILARESRGFTQSELAQRSGVGQHALSRYENGLDKPSEEDLLRIATALEYRPTFFSRSESAHDFGSTCMYHRKRQSLYMRDLKRIRAKVNIDRMNLERLLRSVEIEAAHSFPRLDITEYGNAERIAEMVRRAWNMPLGPVQNILTTIENAGGIVFLYSFETPKMDAISQLLQDMTPVFFVNTDMPWERIRFSLAHEIGHLIMHRCQSNNQEREADAFASAFLMPEREIRAHLKPLSLGRAAELKHYWGVSMQAIIRRARDLGEISESQYRRFFTQISKLGYRTNEPYPILPERPYSLKRLVEVHLEELGYSKQELFQLLESPEWHLQSVYLQENVGIIREVRMS